jgi:hypothetical protein
MPPTGTQTVTDVPPARVDQVVAGFKAQGADPVTKTKQPDGNYTVVAVFPDGATKPPGGKPGNNNKN